MRSLAFLLAKDPVLERTGDMAMASLVMELAAEAYSVSYICLSATDGEREQNVLVRKPHVSPVKLLARAVAERRSLVHTRFSLPALSTAIDRSPADTFVADHSYMAESFLSSAKSKGDLRVNSVVSESEVWGSTHGMLGRVQKSAIEKDQDRIARLATSVATYDATEAAEYRNRGVSSARWLNLTFAPAAEHAHTATAPRLAFVGDRTWLPNQEGYAQLLQWWPRIAAGIPGAELVVIGRPGKPLETPPGVRELGFVDDLDEALNECRGILAPILTGGGVRVKILDSAMRGIPLVATSAAIGSLDTVFSLKAHDDPAEFIEAARRLLLDRDAALREGSTLYQENSARWNERLPHRAVAEWLA